MKLTRRFMSLLLALSLLCGNVITPVLATETATEPEVTVEEITEPVTEEETEEADSETPDEEPSDKTTTPDPIVNEAAAAAEETDVTEETDPTEETEAPVAGTTAENPILLYPNMFTFSEDQSSGSYEVTVPAGTTYYFVLNNAGGMLMSINGGEATALTGNTMNPDTFTIENAGEEEAVYTITISHPAGSQMNPEVLADLGWYDVSLAAGDYDGYYYTFTAPGDGTATFYISSVTDGVVADIIIYNENSSVQKSLLNDGVDNYGLEVTMDVSAGDLLSIQVIAQGDAEGNMYPAAEISWSGSIAAELPGAKTSPIDLSSLMTWNEEWTEATAEVTVPAGSTYWFVVNNGTFAITVDGNEVETEASVSPYGFASTVFSITNENEENTTYAVAISYPVGTRENPEVLEYGLGGYASLEAGDNDGYYYTYTAEADGYVCANITWVTEGVEADMTLMNGSTLEQRSLSADGMNGIVTMAVSEGDVVTIQVVALPDANWNIPAAEIGWTGSVASELPGAKTAPIDLSSLLTWNEKGNEADTEVTVPAGSAYWFVVNNGSFVITVDGNEVETESSVSPYGFASTLFSITNDGEADAAYSIHVSYPVGDYMNPEFLYYTRYIQANLAEGDQDGYFYTYTAQEEGTVVLTGEAVEGVEYDVIITNNATYAMAWMSDSEDRTVSMPVMPGDELTIQVVAACDSVGYIPAATVVLYGSFIYPVGHMMNPERLYYTRYIQANLEEGNDQGYFYTYTAAEDGILVLQGAPVKGVVYDVVLTNNMTWEMGWMSDSDDYTVSVPVSAGDEIGIQVVVSPDANWNIPAATIVLTGSFLYPEGHRDNPQPITYLSDAAVALEEGNDQGYFFNYYCYTDGIIRLYPGFDAPIDVVLLNNTTWEMAWLSDSGEDYSMSMVCHAGDTVTIQVVALPDENFHYPAVNVSLNGHYDVIHLVGTEEVAAGKSVTMKALNVVTGEPHANVYWYLADENYEIYQGNDFTITQKGKLTVKKGVADGTQINVVAVAMDSPEGGDVMTVTVTNTPVTKVEIQGEATQTLTITHDNNTLALTAVNAPEGASQEVTWKSSNTKYATVDENGVVTATEAGIGKTVTITATAADGSGKKDTVKVKILRAVDSIELPEKAVIAAGKSLNLAKLLTINPAKASNKKVTWTADDNEVKVTAAGLLKTAKADAGKTITVTATSVDNGEAVATCEVSVLPAVSKVEIQGAATQTLTITPDNNTLALTAVVSPAEAEKTLTWKSSNKKYATVDENGVVTATEAGIGKTVTITATATDGSGKKDTVKVKILRAVDSIELPETAVIAAGKSLNLAKLLTVNPAKASNKKVTWTAVDAEGNAVKVTAAGLLKTAKADAGKTITVTATSVDNGEAVATCVVSVMVPVKAVDLYIGGYESTNQKIDLLMDSTITNTLTLTAKNTPTVADGICEQAWTWKSSNPKYATVEDGVVTALTAGAGKTVTITATATDGTNKKATIKIKLIQPVESVELTREAGVAGGKTLNLAKMVTISPLNATNKSLKWSVEPNEAGITITSAGVLKTKAVQEAVTVKVTVVANRDYKEYSNTFDVTVYPATKTVNILNNYEDVSGTTITLKVGQCLYLDSVNLDAEEKETPFQSWTWSSAKAKIASVSDDGFVTALKAGTAKITCKAADGTGKTATVTIKVVNAD